MVRGFTPHENLLEKAHNSTWLKGLRVARSHGLSQTLNGFTVVNVKRHPRPQTHRDLEGSPGIHAELTTFLEQRKKYVEIYWDRDDSITIQI